MSYRFFFNTIVKMINVTEEKGEDFRCNFLVFLNHVLTTTEKERLDKKCWEQTVGEENSVIWPSNPWADINFESKI